MSLLRERIKNCSLGITFRKDYSRHNKATKRVDALVDKIEFFCEAIPNIDERALIEKVQNLFQRNGLSQLTNKELSLVFMLGDKSLLSSENIDINLLKGLLKTIKEKGYPNRCTKVVRIFYLVRFDTSTPQTTEITKCLASFLRKAIDSKRDRNWSDLHKTYELFDVDTAPIKLAQGKIDIALKSKEADKLLVRILDYPGISHAAFKETCKTVKELNTNVLMEHINLLIEWACSGNDGLLYQNCRSDLADALLLAWETEPAPSEVVEILLKFFNTYYGNPKIEGNNWHGVSLDAKKVFIRWISIKTLDLFLEVIKKTVTRQEQWEYRRAFWSSYIKKNYVSDIWIVFGTAGYKYIQGRQKLNHLLHRLYGRLQGGSPDQAVLLLQIGDLMIADWSHNGKARGWLQQNTNVPLSGKKYRADELRSLENPVFEIIHHSSTSGGWQRNIASKIESHTRIKMLYNEYMP